MLASCSVRCRGVLALLVIFGWGSVPQARADRPIAPVLLPEKTIACLRIPDTREFVAKFKESSIGRMLDDEQVRPLASSLYGVMADAFGQVQDRVGMSLDELLAVPQGEFCVALIVMPDGTPALVVLLETGERIASAQKLLDRAAEELGKRNVPSTTETVDGTKLTIYDPPGDRPPALVLFQRDGVVVFASQVAAAKQLLERWDGKAPKDQLSLADNRKYTSIMSRCGGGGEDRPHLTFYVDPIEGVRLAARGNTAAQTGLAILPALGLDGLQAFGGSAILGPEEFDAIQHFHLLLDNPRNGVLKVLAMRSGDSTPEPWVPNDVANYMTIHWDFDTSVQEITNLVDSFQGKGATSSFLKQRISEPLGLDIEKDVIAVLDNRVTYLSWFEKPARLNSQSQLVALKLKDPAAFRGTLDKTMERFADNWEKKTFGSVPYYAAKIPEGQRPRAPGDNQPGGVRLELRSPEGCVGVLGDYLVVADSSNLLQHCVSAQSDAARGLKSELDFKLIASKIRRQVGGQEPGMLTFNRPEEGMRAMYEVAKAENTRQMLAAQAERNSFFRGLNDAVSKNALPPFGVFAKYLAPGGGMVVDDETGIHYMAFGLRRK